MYVTKVNIIEIVKKIFDVYLSLYCTTGVNSCYNVLPLADSEMIAISVSVVVRAFHNNVVVRIAVIGNQNAAIVIAS